MALSAPGQTAGISVFIDRVGDDLGISRSTISFLYLLATLCGAVGVPFVGRAIDRYGVRRMLRWIALGLGWLADRVPRRVMVPAVMSVLALALGLLTRVDPGWSVVGYAMLLGASAGAMSSAEGSLLARWFGVDRLGSLRGMLMSVAVLASAVGPVALSLLEGLTGSYVTAAAWTAVVPAVVVVAALVVPLPSPAAPDAASG